MTRRCFLEGFAAVVAGGSACKSQTAGVRERLAAMARGENLAVLRLDASGFEVEGGRSARIALPQFSSEWAVSPDANVVAWSPKGARPSSADGGEPVVWVSERARPATSVRYSGKFTDDLAISSNGSKLALLCVDSRANHRLIVVDVATGKEDDLCAIKTGFGVAEIERLSFSGIGARLAVGSRTSFIVVDLVSRKSMFESSGRFPTLTPDGTMVGYVHDRQLIVRNLEGDASRTLLKDLRVDGIGSWSPNGEYLLAGVRNSALAWRKLVAIDCVNDAVVEFQQLDEGDYGNRCAWVKRTFLTF